MGDIFNGCDVVMSPFGGDDREDSSNACRKGEVE